MLKWLVILDIKSFILLSSLFFSLSSIINSPDVTREQGMCIGASSELDNLAKTRSTWMERRKRKIQLDIHRPYWYINNKWSKLPAFAAVPVLSLLTIINFIPFYAECVALAYCRYTIFPIGDTFIPKPLVWCLF